MQTTFSFNRPLPYCVLVGVCVLHALMIAWLIKTTPTPNVSPPSKVLSVEFINIAPQKINSPLTTSEQRPTKPTSAKDTHKAKKTEVKKPQAKAHTPPAPTPSAKKATPVLATQKSQSTITASTPKSDTPPVKEEVKPIQNLSDQPKQATPKPETVRQEAKQETPKQETLVQKNKPF